ncbi:MAG: hypothetical protein IKQ20_07900 [Bacteroidales bacterium]|nr:hypothetical protein [Bacteroidales bacterium]
MNKDNFIKRIYHNTHLWIVLTCIGVWVLVFQNFRIGTKEVYVVGGEVEAEVSGNVSVDNTVDVNLHEINGYRNCFYNNYSKHPNDYYRIPIAN